MAQREKKPVGQKAKIVAAIFLVVLLFPLIAPVLLVVFLYRAVLYLAIWLTWLPMGKDVLLVYSDSPIWRDYMTNEIMPLVQDRAIVLNWSERKTWSSWSLAVRAHRIFGGEREFNPLVILFRPFRFAKTLRFWPAFKESKHGHPEAVFALREELVRNLID